MKNIATTLTFVQVTVLTALRNPETTVSQLRSVMDTDIGESFKGMTMEEFLGNVAPATASKPKGKAKAKKAAKSDGEFATVSTRTHEEREAYDAAVFAFVKKSKGHVSAQEVRAACGGTSLQARTTLNRLIAADELTYEGKARATKYFVA